MTERGPEGPAMPVRVMGGVGLGGVTTRFRPSLRPGYPVERSEASVRTVARLSLHDDMHVYTRRRSRHRGAVKGAGGVLVSFLNRAEICGWNHLFLKCNSGRPRRLGDRCGKIDIQRGSLA